MPAANLDTMLASPPAPDPAGAGRRSRSARWTADYVVAPGDTLAMVAERTNTPIRSLIDINGLSRPMR